MITSIGKHWWAYSKRNKNFDAVGYTKANEDYLNDVREAMEVISKHLHKSIPLDIQVNIIGTTQ